MIELVTNQLVGKFGEDVFMIFSSSKDIQCIQLCCNIEGKFKMFVRIYAATGIFIATVIGLQVSVLNRVQEKNNITIFFFQLIAVGEVRYFCAK